jgi:hypothetical protein
MEGRVSAASRLKYYYLAYASKPKTERFLYRAVRKSRAARIVEFGLTSLTRSRRLIEAAQRYAPGGNVSFTGIDLFESGAIVPAAADADRQSLIGVFRTLRPSGASLRLLPGRLGTVLTDVANTLTDTDLLLIGQSVADDDLEPAWFYLPRMLHAGSLVLRERISPNEPDATFERVPLSQIQAQAGHRRRSAA